jgi:hypothetical protein
VKLSPMQKLKSTASKWNYSRDVVYVSAVVSRSHWLLCHFPVLLIFAAGVAASVVAMIISPAVVVFVMGGVCIGK